MNQKNSIKKKVSIFGAGPAGLATAYELSRLDKFKNFDITIFEMDKQVGGLSKTLEYKGYRFDLGGHRFYTKFPEINLFYKTFLAKNMLIRKRLSRIYYQRKFYNYPLSATNALRNLGLKNSVDIFNSWLVRQFKKHKDERTFDEWVSNRFGDKLFKIFFKSYTEKVWGVSTSQLSADWAAQRIQDFNLSKAILEAIFKFHSGSKTTITKFFYPKYGPGMLYEKLKTNLIRKRVKIIFNNEVSGLIINQNKISEVIIKNKNKVQKIKTDIVVSTIPFNKLISFLKPPTKIKKQINHLKFRNFITVNLIIKSNPFPDQWIYIHEPDVAVGRIQNFRNWSPYMTKQQTGDYTPIGMEYFCDEGDSLWLSDDTTLLIKAKKEIVKIGLVKEEDIIDGFVYRVKDAYPVYNFDYQIPYKLAKEFAGNFKDLFLCGRGGLFRYNNQDHSILTGFYVARNIISGKIINDVWSVNEENDYLEKK